MPPPIASGTLALADLLDDDERAELHRLGRPRRYGRAASIIVEGEAGDSVFVLVEGRVKVVTATREGRESVLAVLGPGDLIGEFEGLVGDGGPRTASNVALTPVVCRAISGADFRRFLDVHPSAVRGLLRVVIGRLRAADRRRAETASLDTVHRLARFLSELAGQRRPDHAGEIDIAIPLSQEELASLVAASREAVVRALAKLRNMGLISTGRRRITIVDRDGLSRFVG